jgi:hypothetical protein
MNGNRLVAEAELSDAECAGRLLGNLADDTERVFPNWAEHIPQRSLPNRSHLHASFTPLAS